MLFKNLQKNLAYSSAIKRLRKIIPGIGSGFGAWQGYKEMEVFAKNVVDLLEDDNYAGKYSSRYSEAEEISEVHFQRNQNKKSCILQWYQ